MLSWLSFECRVSCCILSDMLNVTDGQHRKLSIARALYQEVAWTMRDIVELPKEERKCREKDKWAIFLLTAGDLTGQGTQFSKSCQYFVGKSNRQVLITPEYDLIIIHCGYWKNQTVQKLYPIKWQTLMKIKTNISYLIFAFLFCYYFMDYLLAIHVWNYYQKLFHFNE